MEDKNFFFQAQFVLLTYPGCLPKEELLEVLKEKCPASAIIIVHETGSDGKYQHTHAVVRMSKRWQTRNTRRLDFKNTHPNLVMLSGQKGFRDALTRVVKEDKELLKWGTNKEESDIIEKVWTSENKSETAMLGREDLSLVGGVSELKKLLIPELKLQWQIDLKQEVEACSDRRKVFWVVDEEGGAGKNEFADHMELSGRGWHIIPTYMSVRNLGSNLERAVKDGWTQRGVIFGLDRCAKNRESVYDVIECVKDGCTTAGPRGKTIWFEENPVVVVFSNWWPDVKALSQDRWDIRKISRTEGGLTLEKVSLQEAMG